MIQVVNQLLTTGTVFIHILLGLLLLMYLFTRVSGTKSKSLRKVTSFIGEHSYTLAFVVSLLSVMTSLFWSEVMKFTPCILCWYQRIFMYPLPILLYIGIVRNERVLNSYMTVLSGLGLMVALYHHLMQLLPKSIALPCKAIGGVSCIDGYEFYYGYITYPLMAATAFLLIILFMNIGRKQVR